MNKIDIVNELSEKINLNQKVAKVVVDTIIDSIKKAIIEGERVEIRGFGSFSLRSYKPYRGRNPKNGEVVDVPGEAAALFQSRKRAERNHLEGKLKVLPISPYRLFHLRCDVRGDSGRVFAFLVA